ncbi:MAG: hypothetical protein ABEH86_09625 [Haloarcula sp.]
MTVTAKTVGDLFDAFERRPNLAVDADLTVEVDGRELAVRGYDDIVTVDLPSFTATDTLLRQPQIETMDAAAALAAAGITVEIQLRGAPVARLGSTAVPSGLAQRLGLGPIELCPEGVLLALTPPRG